MSLPISVRRLTPSARRRRGSALALLALGVTVVLSGCFKVDMALELSSDDTADGSVVIAVARDQAELFGGEDALREALSNQESDLVGDQPTSGTVETKDYEDEDWIGTETVFTDVPLADLDGSEAGDLSITREGDEFVVSGTLDLSQDGMDPSAGPLLDSAEIEVSVTFPGDVVSSNGSVDGTTVTWTPSPGETVELHAVGKAEAGLPWTVIIAVGALLGLVVIGVVLLVAVRKRDGAAPQGDDTGSEGAGSDDSGSEGAGPDDSGSEGAGSDDSGSDDSGSDDVVPPPA